MVLTVFCLPGILTIPFVSIFTKLLRVSADRLMLWNSLGKM